LCRAIPTPKGGVFPLHPLHPRKINKTGEDGVKLLVVIPRRDPIPRGTLLSILKQARLTKEEFLDL
ncbi:MULTISPECIES: type II toxin-antitoxin system HicA family toxin, partial [unclassified Methanoculleus]|uniref:type II toxin-antitoxin system HicA family toxin n=1 Tax=unclassified Methanoculleus TaxID=2619537 RepID=UPI002600FA3E